MSLGTWHTWQNTQKFREEEQLILERRDEISYGSSSCLSPLIVDHMLEESFSKRSNSQQKALFRRKKRWCRKKMEVRSIGLWGQKPSRELLGFGSFGSFSRDQQVLGATRETNSIRRLALQQTGPQYKLACVLVVLRASNHRHASRRDRRSLHCHDMRVCARDHAIRRHADSARR